MTGHIGWPRLRSRWRLALVVIGCAALLAPVWIVRYPPLGDYPVHLADSFVLAHLHDPGYRFSEWYHADWGPTPYMATDAALMMLQRLFPAELSGRIVLSICVLALPLSVWFFARQAQARYELTVLWAFVLAYNVFFLFGYLEHCLSIAGCFAVLGLWLRYLDRPTALRWMCLLAAVVALYSVHLYGFAMAGIIITAYALAKRQSLIQLSLSWLAFVPGVALFLALAMGASAEHRVVFGGLVRKLGWLLAWLEVHRRLVAPVNLVVFGLFIGALAILAWRNSDLRPNRDWLKVAAVLFALYWVLPDGYQQRGIGFYPIDSRVLPFLLIVVVAAVDMGRRSRWFAAATTLIFVVRMASLTQQFLVEQPLLARFARAFEAVPVNARVLPLEGREAVSSLRTLFEPYNFWAYGVIQRGWVSADLFVMPGVHTLRLHEDPYRPGSLWALQSGDRVNWERVRKTYDYVWAYRVPQLSSRLHTIGRLVFAEKGLEVFALEREADGR
jgi:hypothetical protein